MELYIEWDGLVRLDEDDDNVAPLVRVYFTADGWQPHVRATWEQPAEGGFFEDVFFNRAEVDPSSEASALTETEVEVVREWFKGREAWERAQLAAIKDKEDV